MLIKKHFKVRHKILKVLTKHQDEYPIETNIHDRLLKYSEIESKLSQFDKNFLLDNLQYLSDSKEIYCSMEWDKSKFSILVNGRIAYGENKYLSLGRKELRDFIYDILKIVSAAVLLFIATFTFIQNIYQTQQNKKEIKQLQQELQKFKPPINTSMRLSFVLKESRLISENVDYHDFYKS